MTQTQAPVAAAPPLRRVLSQARWEGLTILRNGEQLLVSLVLPALALVGLVWSPFPDLTPDRRIDVVTPGILGVAVASIALTGQAISTAFDRRYGVLRMFGTSPLGRFGLLAGKTLAVLAVLALQWAVLGGLALALGWRPDGAGLLPALISAVLGVAAFLGVALLLAGTVRAEAVLALANLAWVLLLGLGLALPVATLPGWAQPVAEVLPSGALGEALRAALLQGSWTVGPWLVLAVWAAVSWAAALRLFRWAP